MFTKHLLKVEYNWKNNSYQEHGEKKKKKKSLHWFKDLDPCHVFFPVKQTDQKKRKGNHETDVQKYFK